MTIDPPDLSQPLLFRLALREFYEEYAACLDDFDVARWPSFFTVDAVYRITSHENYDAGLPHSPLYCEGIAMIRDRVLAIRETMVYEPRKMRHVVSNLRVLRYEDELFYATAGFFVLEAKLDRDPVVWMTGRYVDTVRRTADGFRFKERICVYDNYRILQSIILPV